jgi:outer membrane protein
MMLRARILAACGLTLFGGALQAADLLSVYERALQNDPLIREADANRLASRESKPQALAALLPQLNANGSYSDVDQEFSRTTLTPSVPSDPNSDLVPRDINTDSDFKSRQYDITLRQTLFRWDQWAALRRADAQVAQAEADYQAAQQDLILRTSQRYFAVIQAKRALATANELLRELTGESFTTLAGPIDDLPLESPSPADEEQWVTSALDQNLRVISARLATDIAKSDVSVARAGHLPSFDIVASREDQDFDGDQVSRNVSGTPIGSPADQTQTTDSIGVQVTVPIYSGGATSSRVRQRVYLHRAARERLERTNRETERAARDAYLGVQSEMSRVQASRQALESSRTALQATEAGFEVGTRTTVDVLQSRRQLFDAQTNYSRSRYDYILTVLQLQLATGTLDRADLEKINAFLKERAITR